MRGNLFAVAVNLVVLTVRSESLHVLLIERGEQPFAGQWALPGGFVRPDEDLVHTASRRLGEETGADTGDAVVGHLEQLASYAAPDRDPRGRVLAVGYVAFVPDMPDPTPGGGAVASAWVPVDRVPALAFDHDRITADGVERAKAKLEYTTLAASFCPPQFTVTDLRRVYEAVWDTSLDPRNFQRKVTSTEGFLLPTSTLVTGGRGRPPRLFRRGPATALHPPMLREPHRAAEASPVATGAGPIR
ncbi:putative Nudix-like regulator [Pseudonocardia sp. Ae168_Ps1]|uniref:NUDIX hydrolase n=1 Tax=unclassified Pseudonocardia TaxID=2619320 RepID=UPI0006CB2F66|nr:MULTISPECIES: NUDIX domain-containing protein [unclassified Pseudonocardia]ALE75245.1 NUDIX hydrolase [Pseudonocardia sp. EC080625-04]ALL74609.1 NUDIX hydrolase [Pseudonocardia sp. EC080610-09]ALL81629.1 NUDIX hydrolase [Pseudonocardia sp. EC080619-01]OLL75318.1 putative Nudix-like regulator [Pseudonocardia sp. Ae150A_Ps1]OLL81313.1 putative Nudix-like regulator [Pseudonocardia sp. Ae168_Ps1]